MSDKKTYYVSPKKNAMPNERSNSLDYYSWSQVILPVFSDFNYRVNRRALRDGMIGWCRDYSTANWFVNVNNYFYFVNEEDAVLFKLTHL